MVKGKENGISGARKGSSDEPTETELAVHELAGRSLLNWLRQILRAAFHLLLESGRKDQPTPGPTKGRMERQAAS